MTDDGLKLSAFGLGALAGSGINVEYSSGFSAFFDALLG